MTETIFVALITAAVTLLGSYWATKQQRNKDTIDRNRRLDEREAAFWQRADVREKELTQRVDDLENELEQLEQKMDSQERLHAAEITTLTQRIQELERMLDEEKARRIDVERENAKLRRENGKLKQGYGRKGM